METSSKARSAHFIGVECHVGYFEARDPEPKKCDFQRVVSVDIDYSVEDGVARLCSVSNRDTEGAVEPGLLQVLPAGEAVVASVPDVERTERVEDTLWAVIEAGRKTVSDDE